MREWEDLLYCWEKYRPTYNFNKETQIIFMKFKAQASLEMVVGLIILLVVAGVVISLVLHYVNPKNMPSQADAMKLRDFQAKCEDYCKDYNSVDYCRYYANVDWDKNAEGTDLIKPGKYWDTCEQRAYCFLVYPCTDRYGTGGQDTLAKCKKVLCQDYKNKYGDDIDSINQALADEISFEGCSSMQSDGTVLEDKDNWYVVGNFESGCG
jgi:hypothetical protein